MPATAKDATVTWKKAYWLRKHLYAYQSVMLRWVAMGQVRVRQTSGFPLYCLEDVKACLREDRPNGERAARAKVKRNDAARDHV